MLIDRDQQLGPQTFTSVSSSEFIIIQTQLVEILTAIKSIAGDVIELKKAVGLYECSEFFISRKRKTSHYQKFKDIIEEIFNAQKYLSEIEQGVVAICAQAGVTITDENKQLITSEINALFSSKRSNEIYKLRETFRKLYGLPNLNFNTADEEDIKNWVELVDLKLKDVILAEAAKRVCEETWKTKNITKHDLIWCELMLERYRAGETMKDDAEIIFRKRIATAHNSNINVESYLV